MQPSDTPAMLSPFEGREVLGCAFSVRKAGDGLSAPLQAAPVELRQGERGFIVLEFEVTDVHFPRVKDSEGLTRLHVLTTQAAGLAKWEEKVATVMGRVRDMELEAEQNSTGQGHLALEGDGD